MNVNESNITEKDEITSDDAVQHVVCDSQTSLIFLLIKWNQYLLVLLCFLEVAWIYIPNDEWALWQCRRLQGYQQPAWIYLDLYIILMQQRHLPDGGNHFESFKLSEIQHDLNRNGGSDGSHYWLKISFWYDITDSKLKLTYAYWLWHKQWWTWLPRCCWWWPWSAMHSTVEHTKKLYPKIK